MYMTDRITVSATELARHTAAVLAKAQTSQDGVLITRDDRPLVRITAATETLTLGAWLDRGVPAAITDEMDAFARDLRKLHKRARLPEPRWG